MLLQQKHPEISVIMSVYNGSNYLEESINSILNQTFENFELIVINDNSDDETLKVLSQIKDRRLKVKNNSVRLGQGESLNVAIKIARGKYIARQDHDDLSYNNRLYIQHKFMEENPEIGLVGSGANFIDKSGKHIKTWSNFSDCITLKWLLLFRNQFIHSSIMFRMSVIKENNITYKDFKFSQDYELWMRIGSKTCIANIDDILVMIRRHSGQKSSSTDPQKSMIPREISFNKISELKHIDIQEYINLRSLIYSKSNLREYKVIISTYQNLISLYDKFLKDKSCECWNDTTGVSKWIKNLSKKRIKYLLKNKFFSGIVVLILFLRTRLT